MAFGIDRKEILRWKNEINAGKIAFLTHYWIDNRFPGCTTVTKVGCKNVDQLISWGEPYGLMPQWIDHKLNYPHFDLFGEKQSEILRKEKQWEQIERFRL